MHLNAPPATDARAVDRGGLLVCVLACVLASACAAPAESAERDADSALASTVLEGAPQEARPDPVALHLARSGPPAEREAAILEALRGALDTARDARASGAARAGAASRVDVLLQELAVVEDWRPLLRAELLAPLGDTAGVDRALENLDPATRLHERWGWAFRVDAREAARDSVGARRVAEQEALQATTPERAAAAWARAGQLALASRDTAGAREALLRSLDAGPEASGAQAAARILDRIPSGSAAESRRIGYALLAAGAFEPAHRRLAPLVGDGSLGEVEEARLRGELGRALVQLRRPVDARAMLAPVLGEAVPASLAAPALYWTGQAALQQGRPADARDAFLRLARRAPESQYAEDALLQLVEPVMAAGDHRQEAELVREFFRVGVGSQASELVAVQFGSRRYLAGDYAGAAEAFDHYLAGARRTATRQQAAYWAALSHTRLGDVERARERLQTAWIDDPISFYGVLAGERLGTAVLDPSLQPGPGAVPGLGTELRSAVTRLRVHQVVPTPGSFAFELERLQHHFFQRGDGAYDFAEALFANGFPIQGVVLGREIHRREGEWNLRLLRIVFPFPHREVIVREARARGLDPFFVAGLIRQESMFHASIASSAGAIGLMQLMPGTAQEVARSLGIRYDRTRLEDPEYNVRLGTQYLGQMLRRYDGRAEDALSAYNAGPGRINQWRQRPEYRDRDVFMEHIPFRETRHYVKVVQQYTRIYTALYGCAGFSPCLGDSYLAAVARSPYAGGQPGSSLAR
jgi:soluble lytic murein transglycosylase-like protein